MTETYFFDLDGTLCDSKPGLVLALNASFRALGIRPGIDPARFIGAQLPEIFRTLKPGISEADVAMGVEAFRAEFEARGIYQAPLFPGALGLLMALKEKGKKIWIATAKPEYQAVRIMNDLCMAERFDGITGADDSETETKDKILARALEKSGADPKTSVMTGDRMFDVRAAVKNNIRPIGALWGYGNKAELEEAGCKDFAEDLTDFAKKFL